MARARSAPSSAALALPGLGDVVRAEPARPRAVAQAPVVEAGDGRLTLADLARLDAVQAGAKSSAAAKDAAGATVENCALPCRAYECSEKRDRSDPWCGRHGALLGYSDTMREIHARGTAGHEAMVMSLRGVIAARQGKRIPTPAEERAALEAERAETEARRVRLTGHLCGSACAVDTVDATGAVVAGCPRRWVPQLVAFYPRPERATRWELSEEVRRGLAELPAGWGNRIVPVASLPKELQERIRAREAQDGRDHIFPKTEKEASDEFRKVIEAAAARYEAERTARNGSASVEGRSEPGERDAPIVCVRSEDEDPSPDEEGPSEVREPAGWMVGDEAALYAPRLDDCDPSDGAADFADVPRSAASFRAAAWARFDVTGRAACSRWNPRSPRFIDGEWWAHLARTLARTRDDSRYAAESGHECHARGCATKVPPRLLMCGPHWRRVPKELQEAVWKTYRKGQEIDKRPTPEYLAAANDAIEAVVWVEWWERREARNR